MIDDSLQFIFPRGFWNNNKTIGAPTSTDLGLQTSVWTALEHRQQLSGDFDITVSYENFQQFAAIGASGLIAARLYVSPTPIEQITSGSSTFAFISRDGSQYQALVQMSGTVETNPTTATSDFSGQFRITRSGSTVTLYYWEISAWVQLATYASYDTSDSYVAIYFAANDMAGCAGFTDFGYTSATPVYPASGTYTSALYDAGSTVSFDTISWQADVPTGASIEFLVAVSSTNVGPFTYVGPDGTSATYFTSPGLLPTLSGRYCSYQATLSSTGTATPTLTIVGVTWTGDDTSQDIDYQYDGAGNMTANIATSGGTTTASLRNNPSWDSSDQINNLNQIMRNDTLSSPPLYDFAVLDTSEYDSDVITVTNRYAYDLSGNVTSITPWVPITGDIANGSNTVSGVSLADMANVTVGEGVQNAAFPSGTVVDTVASTSFTVSNNATATASGATLFVSTAATTLSWDEDNRLTQVTLPDAATITYNYDVDGRMLTRTDTSGTTQFEWDGMDCVRETAPSTGTAIYDTSAYDGNAEYGSGGMTQYYVVNGALRQLVRDNAAYAVVCDAIGSVRLVLDDTGAAISNFQYDAWGNILSSSYDNLPGGMAYRFVGGLGCRWDSGAELTQMRARWYDSVELRRFITRDPLRSRAGKNAYEYGLSNPVINIDPSGTTTSTRSEFPPGIPPPLRKDCPPFSECFGTCYDRLHNFPVKTVLGAGAGGAAVLYLVGSGLGEILGGFLIGVEVLIILTCALECGERSAVG